MYKYKLTRAILSLNMNIQEYNKQQKHRDSILTIIVLCHHMHKISHVKNQNGIFVFSHKTTKFKPVWTTKSRKLIYLEWNNKMEFCTKNFCIDISFLFKILKDPRIDIRIHTHTHTKKNLKIIYQLVWPYWKKILLLNPFCISDGEWKIKSKTVWKLGFLPQYFYSYSEMKHVNLPRRKINLNRYPYKKH